MRALVLGSAAGGGFPQWNCNCATCRAAREPGARATPRTQSSLAVRGEDGPWFLFNASPDLRRQLALVPTERTNGLRSTVVAGVVLTDAAIVERLDASDCVLVDGTFWTNDELVSLGIATRDAAAMGHAPVSDTLPVLSRLKARTILVHVNNTNPILLDDSKERATVEAG